MEEGKVRRRKEGRREGIESTEFNEANIGMKVKMTRTRMQMQAQMQMRMQMQMDAKEVCC